MSFAWNPQFSMALINIATAGVVAPFLIHSQDLLSYKVGGADAICRELSGMQSDAESAEILSRAKPSMISGFAAAGHVP